MERTPEQEEAFIDKVVTKTLTTIGFDLSDPIELQKDMAWVRGWRKVIQRGGVAAIVAAMALVVPAALAALWLGVKQRLGM